MVNRATLCSQQKAMESETLTDESRTGQKGTVVYHKRSAVQQHIQVVTTYSYCYSGHTIIMVARSVTSHLCCMSRRRTYKQ
eukprot:9834-Heterococcus_DN1.PRE.8